MNDGSILDRISSLVDEENRLRSEIGAPDHGKDRLRHLTDQLDVCWDLLRQRRAAREFGTDPDTAKARSLEIVKRYEG